MIKAGKAERAAYKLLRKPYKMADLADALLEVLA
jgi:hypothetical protein